MKTMQMRVVNTKTDGAEPVYVEVEADDRYLTIRLFDSYMQLPVEKIREIVREEDDLK